MARLVVLVQEIAGVCRPAVVECVLGVLDDLPDRGARTIRTPGVVDKRLVDVRIEEHRASVEKPGMPRGRADSYPSAAGSEPRRSPAARRCRRPAGAAPPAPATWWPGSAATSSRSAAPRLSGAEQARAVAANVTRALSIPVTLDGLPLDVSGSVGIALYPEHGNDFATLMRDADVAMYDAKHRGDGAAVVRAESDHNTPRRLALVGGLRPALESPDGPGSASTTSRRSGSRPVTSSASRRCCAGGTRALRPGRPGPLIKAPSSVMRQLTRWVLEQSNTSLSR